MAEEFYLIFLKNHIKNLFKNRKDLPCDFLLSQNERKKFEKSYKK